MEGVEPAGEGLGGSPPLEAGVPDMGRLTALPGVGLAAAPYTPSVRLLFAWYGPLCCSWYRAGVPPADWRESQRGTKGEGAAIAACTRVGKGGAPVVGQPRAAQRVG
eukprot:654688-Rhodomonas_salina.1